jgi:hypothetical protein
MVFGCIEAYFILFRFETMKEKKSSEEEEKKTNKIMNSKIVFGFGQFFISKREDYQFFVIILIIKIKTTK